MRTTALPIALILVGAAFLLDKLGMLHLSRLGPIIHQWWPAALILIGIALLIRNRR